VASVDPSAIEKLKTGLQGTACTPGEEGYDEGRKAFNLNAHQEPALVVVAGAAADIVAAVELALSRDLESGCSLRDTVWPTLATGAFWSTLPACVA